MDEIRKNILREQEIRKARLSAHFDKSFSSNGTVNEDGRDVEATATKSANEVHQETQRQSVIKAIEIDGIDDALDILNKAGEENLFQKAVYADTAENRKLGRVGQEWGNKKKETTNKKNTVNLTRISKKDYQKLLDETIDENKEHSLSTLKTIWSSLNKGVKRLFNDWAQAVDDANPNQNKLRKKYEEAIARKEAITHLIEEKKKNMTADEIWNEN